MKISNTPSTFLHLWRTLGLYHDTFPAHYRRFCPRRIIQSLFPHLTPSQSDDLIFRTCLLTHTPSGRPLQGYDLLPDPASHPRLSRDFLAALLAAHLHIGIRHIRLHDLDHAYSLAFPNSTPLNISKKKRPHQKPLHTSPS